MLKSKLIKLNTIQNVVAVRGQRILSNSVSLHLSDHCRVSLWWYNPKTTVLHYSAQAKRHFKLDDFAKDFDPTGWVRGALIKAEGKCVLLVYKCDFPDEIILGPTLVTIYELVRVKYRKRINMIVDEEGHDLLNITKGGV